MTISPRVQVNVEFDSTLEFATIEYDCRSNPPAFTIKHTHDNYYCDDYKKVTKCLTHLAILKEKILFFPLVKTKGKELNRSVVKRAMPIALEVQITADKILQKSIIECGFKEERLWNKKNPM